MTSRRFAVVTGASSGVGRELAREFAANGQAVYNASKSFVQSFALALRDELMNSGITARAALQRNMAEPGSAR